MKSSAEIRKIIEMVQALVSMADALEVLATHTEAQVSVAMPKSGDVVLAARRLVVLDQLAPEEKIRREAWSAAIELRAALYSPKDKGAHGKLHELEERLQTCKASWRYWSDFRAHKPGVSDGLSKTNREDKSGAGDWGVWPGSYEKALEAMRHSKRRLVWDTRWFRIDCTFSEFAAYLDTYKRGIGTFFPRSKARERTNGTLLVMQTISNSATKLAFLSECPYNVKQ